jgi:hypothetical protein
MKKILVTVVFLGVLAAATPAQAEWPDGVIRWSNRNAKVVEILTTDEVCDQTVLPAPDSCISTWRVQAKRRAKHHDVRVQCTFTAYALPNTTPEVQTLRFDTIVRRKHSWTFERPYVVSTSDWACTGRKLPS